MLFSSILVINVPVPTPPLCPICNGELVVVNVEPFDEVVAHLNVGGVKDRPDAGLPAGIPTVENDDIIGGDPSGPVELETIRGLVINDNVVGDIGPAKLIPCAEFPEYVNS